MNLAEESPNSEEEEEQPRRRRRKDKRKGRRRRRRRGGRARLSVTMEMLQNVALVLACILAHKDEARLKKQNVK